MKTYDILIIGAGPAGSTLAWALNSYNLYVGIMDKAHFPRPKLCAGWVTPQVFSKLNLSPGDYGRDHLCQPITGFKVSVMGEAIHKIDCGPSPVSYTILRHEFDNYLLSRCKADNYLGQPCRQLHYDGRHWIVNNSLKTRLLVGAGGHFCPVARRISPKASHPAPTLICQETEIHLSYAQADQCPVKPTHPELFFCRDLKGYGWIVRKGDHLTIGLGREDTANFKQHMKKFISRCETQNKIPPGTPLPLRGHAYLTSRQSQRPLTADHTLLIGDAAGLAAPKSGEGIGPAVDSALLAANVIQQADGPFNQTQLNLYSKAVCELFGPRKCTTKQAIQKKYELKAPIARWLLKNPLFIRHLLINRWFLTSA